MDCFYIRNQNRLGHFRLYLGLFLPAFLPFCRVFTIFRLFHHTSLRYNYPCKQYSYETVLSITHQSVPTTLQHSFPDIMETVHGYTNDAQNPSIKQFNVHLSLNVTAPQQLQQRHVALVQIVIKNPVIQLNVPHENEYNYISQH